MPELPEVETVRRDLARHLVGARITGAEVWRERSIRQQPGGRAEFLAEVSGQTIAAVSRRGKFLWLDFGNGTALQAHLGMSGQLLVRAAPVEHPHLRVRLWVTGAPDDTTALDFVDQRTFGHLLAVELVETETGMVPASLSHIAPDALDLLLAAGTPARQAAVAAIGRRGTAIKALLLQQGLVSGIGNIYADEALWRARINPQAPASTLTEAQIEEALTAAATVMGESLAAGGTSFDELYVDALGRSGAFQHHLSVYGRAGEPCPRCGTPIAKVTLQGRGTHFCPACQVLPAAAAPTV
ncbi:MAG: bifunctional DNA-formamidopyrimidine glycosylase/DNA-(apurinic or apyrimidinic site) lyase [Promicromonosporaceae bacterium]|nr:bifunctional DNA-formamidopyrimidine glycosylase/DNA-(apurinic or apyrimidinic site) lyase [Promicromonosporaceae bacterium]